MKLKKNNIYLMHFVQPATAMLPDLISSSCRPKNWFTVTQSLSESSQLIQATWGVRASELQTPPL